MKKRSTEVYPKKYEGGGEETRVCYLGQPANQC